MNTSSTPATLHRHLLAYSITCLLALGGCGGGGGGGDQEPDPVVVDLPLAYVERPLPLDEDGNSAPEDILSPTDFNPGAALYIKDRATPSAAAINITAAAFGGDSNYDVKDIEVSSDGRRLLFAMRAPEIEDADDDEQPTWNIWEYDLDTNTLRRIIVSDINAEAGQDINPAYLPDDRIVFASTRQRRSKAILLDDNKPQFAALEEDRDEPAFVLHIMDNDGTNIEQLTFNQSHDLQPTVLSDGRILFNRWDNIDNRNNISLYTIKPDGSELSLYYGFNSQNAGTNAAQIAFHQPRQLEDGTILAYLKPRSSDRYGGDIVIIDGENYIDIDQPVFANSGATSPGQTSLSAVAITSDDSISVDGRFASAWPFADGTNRVLASWSQCRVINPDTNAYAPCTAQLLADPAIEEAPPLYGLWIYDLDTNTQQPLISPTEGIMYSEAVTMEPRTAPIYIPDPIVGSDLDENLVNESVGVIHIRSVYDLDGVDSTANGITAMADPQLTPAEQRPAQFLRIVKAVGIPDDDLVDIDNSNFGRSTAQLMREILGYVPIEPDGSVKFKAPADVALMISVVDANGMRISQRHNNWLQLRPGEERECSGCHASNSGLPHGRPDAEAPSVNAGSLTTGSPFPNTESSLFTNAGESMAETYARINGVRTPSVDVIFTDEWTDDTGSLTKAASFSYLYANLTTAAPVSAPCQTGWNSLCRTVINYEEHIQPLWELPRVDAIAMTDHTCTSCHNGRDAGNVVQVPAGQLELTNAVSPEDADQIVSYRELFFTDNLQEINDAGVLADILVQDVDANGDPLFRTDANGDLVLDGDGNPIPILVTIPGGAPAMSTAGALSSTGFFSRFATGATHDGYLTPDELRLIAEWLDIGAQYYNNPFDIPVN